MSRKTKPRDVNTTPEQLASDAAAERELCAVCRVEPRTGTLIVCSLECDGGAR